MPLFTPPTAGFRFTNKSGAYLSAQQGLSSSATLSNATLRLVPVFFGRAFTCSAIGTEFTVAGDNVSLYRMVIYQDDGTGYPGSLLLDGGSISTGTSNSGTVTTGGTPGVYMNTTIAATPITAGWYWIGGAVQGVSSVQPTMRIAYWEASYLVAPNSTPTTGQVMTAYIQGSVTGTPPSSITAWSGNTSGVAPARIILKVQ